LTGRPSENSKVRRKPPLLAVGAVFVILAFAGALIVYWLSDWSAPAQARKLQNPVRATAESIAAAKAIYARRCAECHGQRGDGKGEKAGHLSVAPTNFTDTRELSESTDGELFWKISEGHRPMPRFKDKLSETERWELVNYVRSFAVKP